MDFGQGGIVHAVQYPFQHQCPVQRVQRVQGGAQLLTDAGVRFGRLGQLALLSPFGGAQHIQRRAVGDAVQPGPLIVLPVAPQAVPPQPGLYKGGLYGVLGVRFTAQHGCAVPQQRCGVGMYQLFQVLLGLHTGSLPFVGVFHLYNAAGGLFVSLQNKKRQKFLPLQRVEKADTLQKGEQSRTAIA